MREYRPRDGCEATAETQDEQKNQHRGRRHQRSLKDIVVDAGENSARSRIRQRDSHPDPDSPSDTNAENGIDDDSHRQRIRCHIPDYTDENRDGRKSLCPPRSVAGSDCVGDRDQSARFGQQAHSLGQHPGTHDVRHRRRKHDVHRTEPGGVDETWPADEREPGNRDRHRRDG